MSQQTLGIVHCFGPDAEKFLQGQLSNNMLVLTPSQGAIACYLNLKGRVFSLMFVIKKEDGFWLIMPRDLIPAFLHKLKKFIVFSKAKLEDISEQFSVEGVVGDAVNIPPYSVQSTPDAVLFYLKPEKGLLLRITQSQQNTALSDEFLKSMFQSLIPWIGLEQSEKFLPHYIGLIDLQAIDFEKGCFVGQEVVARMQYRGRLDKKLVFIEGPDLEKDEIINELQYYDHTYLLVSRGS